MEERPALKPCPFCGGPPALYEADIGGEWWHAHIWCHECGARGGHAQELAYDDDERRAVRDEAISEWNARDDRHRGLYDAAIADGLTRRPE